LKAHQHYKQIFTPDYLRLLFREKISLSSAIGRDGIRKGVFEENLENEIGLILSKAETQTYHFTGYREKLISKGPENPPRQISIPTVRDRLTLRAICDLVSAVFQDCKHHPPHEYIKAIKAIAAGLGESDSFLRMDIKNYYPSIDHKILFRRLRRKIRKRQVVSLIEKAIKTPTGKKNSPEYQNLVGVPQGLSISNILSALYLSHIDEKYKAKTTYFRYVDDILILCKSSEVQEIYKSLKTDLQRTARVEAHSLEDVKSSKTRTAGMAEGIDYLGFHITNKGISVRSSSYKKMFTNLLKVFTQYKYKKNKKRLLWRLNLKITGCLFEGKRLGWMFFFSQTDNTSQLKRLDEFVIGLAKKFLPLEDRNKIKTFIKTFHEIRFNAEKTKYIPNFETYTLEKKIEIICLLTGKKEVEVEAWDVDFIEEQFRKCAAREAGELEKDLLEIFS